METLTGRTALEDLVSEGKYLFHGSPEAGIEKCMPQQQQSRAASHGTPVTYDGGAVFATEYIDVAIFAAVVFHLGRSGWYTHDESTPITFTFNADAEVVAKAKQSTGYVYVFPKELFEHSKTTNHEYVSEQSITPCYCVKVTSSDLQPPLDQLQPDLDPSH